MNYPSHAGIIILHEMLDAAHTGHASLPTRLAIRGSIILNRLRMLVFGSRMFKAVKRFVKPRSFEFREERVPKDQNIPPLAGRDHPQR
jgi:hypothetical protein